MSSIVKKRQTVKSQQNHSQITASSWQGPLPHPKAVQQFDEIISGGAERIFKMAEIEQSHRHAMERAIAENAALVAKSNEHAQLLESAAINRGTYTGAALSTVAIISAVVSVYLNAHPTVPIAFVGIPLMGAVRAMILRK